MSLGLNELLTTIGGSGRQVNAPLDEYPLLIILVALWTLQFAKPSSIRLVSHLSPPFLQRATIE